MCSTSLWRVAGVSKVIAITLRNAVRTDSRVETLLLDGEVEDYEYLNKSRREVDGIDDQEEWNLLKVSAASHQRFRDGAHSCVERT